MKTSISFQNFTITLKLEDSPLFKQTDTGYIDTGCDCAYTFIKDFSDNHIEFYNFLDLLKKLQINEKSMIVIDSIELLDEKELSDNDIDKFLFFTGNILSISSTEIELGLPVRQANSTLTITSTGLNSVSEALRKFNLGELYKFKLSIK